jgi:hypothetical protein
MVGIGPHSIVLFMHIYTKIDSEYFRDVPQEKTICDAKNVQLRAQSASFVKKQISGLGNGSIGFQRRLVMLIVPVT